MLVEQVDVGLDPDSVGGGHPRVAVAGVAGWSRRSAVVGSPAEAQRSFTEGPDAGVGLDGLEAGIQKGRVHIVGVLLRADLAGQCDLGEHGVRRLVADVSPMWRSPSPENAGPY